MGMMRSLLPVGQGSFYVEKFDGGATVVYDCGTLSPFRLLTAAIDRAFNPGDIIQAVFISHLDADHVNGLSYLVGRCHVQRVYLPLLTTEEKRLTTLCMHLETGAADPFLTGLVYDPVATLQEAALSGNREAPHIFYIEAISRDSDRPGDFLGEEEPGEDLPRSEDGVSLSGRISRPTRTPSGTELSLSPDAADWVYVPSHFRETARQRRFLKALTAKGIPLAAMDDPREVVRRLEDLKEIYLTVGKDLNVNSMTLYSGPNCVHSDSSYSIPHDSAYSLGLRYPAGCLYTGDYDTHGASKWWDLYGRYERYLRYIGTFQIPHHGASRSFNKEMLRRDRLFFLSAGTVNSFRHPHKFVLRELALSRVPFYWISEKAESGVDFTICF